ICSDDVSDSVDRVLVRGADSGSGDAARRCAAVVHGPESIRRDGARVARGVEALGAVSQVVPAVGGAGGTAGGVGAFGGRDGFCVGTGAGVAFDDFSAVLCGGGDFLGLCDGGDAGGADAEVVPPG